MKKIVSLLLPLIGVAIFVLIIRSIGVRPLLDTFRAIEPRRLLIFPLFWTYIIWIRGARWRHLMRMIDID